MKNQKKIRVDKKHYKISWLLGFSGGFLIGISIGLFLLNVLF